MKNYLREWETPFMTHRPFLIAFSFRMTGSLAESEELVQETFLECAEVDPSAILNHRSWLTKVCSNKSIDLLRSAYKRRETYSGPWLPDAVPDSFQLWDSLDDNLLLSESLAPSFLLLAENLTPEERAVYLLSEVFEYSFSEIGEFLNKSAATLRKTGQRAREAINSERIRFDSTQSDSMNLVVKFFELAKKSDKSELSELLAEGSEYWPDGGGKVASVRSILRNRNQIAAFFSSQLMSSLYQSDEFKFETGFVNGLPGLIISRQLEDKTWVFDTIMSFETVNGQIARIYAQRNPEKLASLMQLY